jgi:hypothetical protein
MFLYSRINELSYHVLRFQIQPGLHYLYVSNTVKQKQVNNRIYYDFSYNNFISRLRWKESNTWTNLNQFLRIKRYGKFLRILKNAKRRKDVNLKHQD